jgi:hypothetical protein
MADLTSHGHLDGPFKKLVLFYQMYDLTLGQNSHFSQENKPKEPCVFHAPCL